MEKSKLYTLPTLPYDYSALVPFISEEQLKIHHQKHHQAYVNGANAIFANFEDARLASADFDVKATLKELSFHVGGFNLHNLFWENLAPPGLGGGGLPSGELAKALNSEYLKFDRFQKEFTQAGQY